MENQQYNNMIQPLQPVQMTSPFMPQQTVNNNNNQTYQFQNKQQYTQIISATGWQKLEFMEYCYMRVTKVSGCSDFNICDRFVTEIEIKFEKDAYEDAFQIRFDDPSLCKSIIDGKIVSVSNSNRGQNEENMYTIKHDRNCCFLKSLCMFIPLFQCCLYYGLQGCCKPSAKLYKNDQILSTYKYNCCADKVTFDSQQLGQLTLRRVDGQASHQEEIEMQILDSNQNPIPGRNFYIEYYVTVDEDNDYHSKELWKKVQFPKNLSIDEKMTMIYAISKL